ncbi:MAG TPA: HEAT repeat domain-containing protein [Pyrinomonadaceae bacterium]|nr:HEAT repeat domain-containing protein [Pyrinomonadaceae bacterium]
MTFLLAAVAFIPSLALRAQKAKDSPVHVAGVSERKTASGSVITLSADMPLNRTQTWQDGEGFHLVVPHAGKSQVRGIPKGVHVRQLDESLELLLPLKQGASVTVEPGFNHLNLVVNGSMDASRGDAEESTPPPSRQRQGREPQPQSAATYSPRLTRESHNSQTPSPILSAGQPEHPVNATSPATQPAVQPRSDAGLAPSSAPSTSPQKLAHEDSIVRALGVAQEKNQPAQPSQGDTQAGPSSLFDVLFSVTGVALFLLCGCVALFLLRRRARRSETWEDVEQKRTTERVSETAQESTLALATMDETVEIEQPRERRRARRGRRASDQIMVQKTTALPAQDAESNEQSLEIRQPGGNVVSPALFGSYRVDQEVCKLLLGQPHRLDVLLSRATDDRRAMETSLMKALQSAEATDDVRRRSRRALEEYGFVARQSAALLLAHDAYERASAARTLGEIGSPLALSFLLEALHDAEMVVRTHAVSSLGALRLPSAIGALLDMAWRHPEMSAAQISRVLSACSVETLEGLSSMTFEAEHSFLSDSPREHNFTGEIMHLDPAARVEQLPEWLEDETLSEALARLESTDVEARTAAVRQLAQFQVQRSVEALTIIAGRDEDSSVRAAAVSSLCAIDHESVFAPVLIALADDAREVRAAAARSLSRLNFDRADAYVRVQETSDAETLREVARSCIKAGIARQAIDRLASADRRQAYEAFSLLSILAKSNQTEPILEAIASHPEINVQLAATRLLGLAGRPEVAAQLRQLVVRDGLPEKVRTAILEVVYKMDQAQPV